MRCKPGLSRRHMLATSVAAGGLALVRGIGAATAQTAKRIEQLAPELDKIVSASEPIQDLAQGFGGSLGPAEGPLWWKEGGYLLFKDVHNNRRIKYTPGTGRHHGPRAHQPPQRAHPRPPGAPARLRTRDAARHPA